MKCSPDWDPEAVYQVNPQGKWIWQCACGMHSHPAKGGRFFGYWSAEEARGGLIRHTHKKLKVVC